MSRNLPHSRTVRNLKVFRLHVVLATMPNQYDPVIVDSVRHFNLDVRRLAGPGLSQAIGFCRTGSARGNLDACKSLRQFGPGTQCPPRELQPEWACYLRWHDVFVAGQAPR